MQSHLARAVHNKSFLECLESNFPDHYYDWKITTCFYIAIHLVKALGDKRGVDFGSTHEEIARCLDPKRGTQATQFPPRMWDHYKKLYYYSRNSRYSGIIDPDAELEIRKDDYMECQKHLAALKSYFRSQQLDLDSKAA